VESDGLTDSIFSPGLNGMPGIDMYRAWVVPDLFPDQKQPRLENWSAEDLEAFCGIYK
jgi:hypothetical protein